MQLRKHNFRRWLEQQAEETFAPRLFTPCRSGDCPLAAYLRDRTSPHATVGVKLYFLSEDDDEGRDLPLWAHQFRYEFDASFSGPTSARDILAILTSIN